MAAILHKLIKKDEHGKWYYDWREIDSIGEFHAQKEEVYWTDDGVCEPISDYIKRVCDAASAYVSKSNIPHIEGDPAVKEVYDLIHLSFALFHAIGMFVTEDGKYWRKSEQMTRTILWDEDVELRESVCSLIRYHADALNAFKYKDFVERLSRINHLSNLWVILYCNLHIANANGRKETDMIRLKNLFRFLTHESISEDSIFDFVVRGPMRSLEVEYQKPNVIDAWMMIGIPGSGKSTEAKRVLSNLTDNGIVAEIVSRDEIRLSITFGENEDRIEIENRITEIEYQQIKDCIGGGKLVIVDKTNTIKKHRDMVKALFRGHTVRWHYVYCQAPTLEQTIKRREDVMSEITIMDMIERFEWPQADEYYDLRIV